MYCFEPFCRMSYHVQVFLIHRINMTCHCRTYLGAFSWLLGQRNLKRREFQGVHSLEHLQLWVIQAPVVQGSSTLPLTLGPRSLFPVHCWVFSSSPGFCPLHARSILPFAVTAKHISSPFFLEFNLFYCIGYFIKFSEKKIIRRVKERKDW